MTRMRFTDADADDQAFAAELDAMFGPLRDRFARCPPPAVLRAAGEGVLPSAVGASVRAHVDACPMCRMLTRDLADLPVRGLDDIERQRIVRRVEAAAGLANRSRGAFRRAWWAAAGGAVAVAASLLLASIPSPDVAVPAVRQPARLPIAAVPRVSALAVDKPPVRLPLVAALSLRGAADVNTDLRAALDSYRNDDFGTAAERLARVVPNDALPQLAVYLGVSYLHAGDPASAERTLTAALSTSLDVESVADAEWYLAIARARLGDIGTARRELERVCAGHSGRAMQACAGAAELTR